MNRPLAWLLAIGAAVALNAPTVAKAQTADPLMVPGAESFARPPETPIELWDAVDYLVRAGHADQAVPYLDRFLKSDPSDDVLLEIRDKFGSGSVLRLQDDPKTRAQAEPLMRMLAAASKRQATRPDRLRRFADALTATRQEQDYAVARLREAGPYAVPALVDRLGSPALDVADRARIVANIGRLEPAAVPALVAVLDSPNTVLAADVADALGMLGDRRAVPFLTFAAARPDENAVSEPARRSIARLTGIPYNAQTRTPLRVLADEARKYLTHAVVFPSDQVVLWSWEGDAPVPKTVSKGDAESILGLRFAREALMLKPDDAEAQALLVALALQHSVNRVGIANFPANDPEGTYPLALAAGPDVMGKVVREALSGGLSEVAAAAVTVLGRVTDRNALWIDPNRPHPLVEALSSPDRRVRFAAARALVELAPQRPFPGSSRVVSVLAQFLASEPSAPRAVVIDGDVNESNKVASALKGLGYDVATADNGRDGFRAAAQSAGVELVLLNPAVLNGSWQTIDTLTNLRADVRTAGLPIFLYSPLAARPYFFGLLAKFDRIGFLVTPTDPNVAKAPLERELARMGTRPLSAEERASYAQGAAALLASITARPGSPYADDLAAIEPELSRALNSPATDMPASAALADVPDVDAQRELADAFLDGSRPLPLRLSAGESLARSIQRFGPLVSVEQERALLAAFDGATDPAVRASAAAVVGALRPKASPVGLRLRNFQPAGAP
jgi:HEAT repeat protein